MRSNSRGNTSRLTFTLLLAALTITTFGCEMFNESRQESYEFDQLEYGDEITRLSVEAGSGDIEVIATDQEVVTVDVVIHGEDTIVAQGLQGDRLWLRTECDGDIWSCGGVDYIITAPSDIAVELSTGSGDILIDGTKADATLDTGSGNVDVRCFSGRQLEMDTGSGDITGRNLISAEITGDCGSGDIDLQFDHVPTRVVLGSGSGDIDLLVPVESYAVAHDTGSGDVSISGITVDEDSPRALCLSSGSGDISVQGQ